MKTNVKHLLDYREPNYFNTNDYLLMYVPSLKRFWITKSVFYNGAWYGGNYKLTSVLTCIATDFYKLNVQIENSKGTVVKCMDDVDSCLGVLWAQGTKELPPFWNNINKLLTV